MNNILSTSFRKIYQAQRSKFIRNPVTHSEEDTLADNATGFRLALAVAYATACLAGMTFLSVMPAHAAEKPKLDPAACQAINATAPPGVNYQPSIDVHGHYVAPADISSNNAVQLPKKIQIPLTISLAKALNLDTTQAPYSQLGEGTEATLGIITVEGNKVTLNGKSLNGDQQKKLSAICASSIEMH